MTTHYHSGFDYFTPDAGEHKSMFCLACNTKMDVERNVEYIDHRYPTSNNGWALPLGDIPTRQVDKFHCPYAGKDWHTQVIAIRRFQRDTPSRVLSDLVEDEITSIIKSKKITKETWSS